MRNIGGVERAWDSVPMCLFGDLVLKNGQYVIGELLFDFILSRGKVMTYDCFLYRRSGDLRHRFALPDVIRCLSRHGAYE